MSTRLIILVVVAACLAVYFAVPSKRQTESVEVEMSAKELERLRVLKTPLCSRDLPGEEPDEPVEISVRVEVDITATKNRLYFYLTEAHGYYVEAPKIEVYHLSINETTGEQVRIFVFDQPLEIYMQADKTLKHCLELVPAELEGFGGDIGTGDDWMAEVVGYCRARANDPDALPLLGEEVWCR